MSQSSEVSGPSRRGFLSVLLGIGAVGWIGSLLFPVFRYLKPLPSSGANEPIRLGEEDLAKIDREHFTIVSAGSKRVLVFRPEEEDLRAVDAKCTHEGCTVQFVPGESMVWCACHNGRFDVDGRVLSGPPPRPLEQYVVHRDGDGNLLVTPEQA